MNWTFQVLVLIFVSTIVITQKVQGLGSCPLAVKSHGCFEDGPKPHRVLPDLILYRRGSVDWKNYDKFLQGFICDCAKVAKKKRYEVFGIQYFAECWGNKTYTEGFLPSYREKPKLCLSKDLKTACSGTGSDRICTGQHWANFVFLLEKPQVTEGPPGKDACISNPCKNGGKCNLAGHDNYTCKCTEGFHGKQCEKEDACISHPCHNGATCTVTGDKIYQCQCAKGFFAPNCEKENACTSHPCKNGATCSATGDKTYQCECAKGFFGPRCGKEDACTSHPCKNGATCMATGDKTYQCECAKGFFGPSCGKEDACTSHPCKNGATCTTTGDKTYECQCAIGFFGPSCGKVDGCSKLPCRNGATCHKTGNNTYSCECTVGYFGRNCSKVNQCIVHRPCQNRATCTSTGNSTYLCHCPKGFYGFNCQKDCSFPLDIAFAIDASGSIGHRSYKLVKAFLKAFTSYFEVNHTAHFACLHYDHDVYIDFEFKDIEYRNHSALNEKIDSITHTAGGTFTDAALVAVRKFFLRKNGARDEAVARRCVVILTDGPTYWGKESLIHPTYVLKEHMHVRIVPIGVGRFVREVELQIMADQEHYVLVNKFNELAKAITDVMDLVCKA